ncbi:hypothetical protein QVD17_06734 [Tagetes erecta]|uniref:Uncharacterized protein n=1 Tax=Tagetes erecta TaxID=13708 RepID=A0AAD8LKS8_TARER|nr:hypothetical protein QVD17_06734 [Tagetes erecta]
MDGDSITLSLFHLVENFYWDAKLALILATFALIYSTDQLEMSMDIFEQAPAITEYSTPLKPRSDQLANSFTRYGISSIEIESCELSTLVLKINPLLEFLRKQLEEYNHVIGKKKEIDITESFSQVLDTVHIENMKILKILLNPWDEPLSLFDGATKQRVNLEVLRKRIVLLLISGLDMSWEEMFVLEQIYSESHVQVSRMKYLYEVVWVPIVDLNVMKNDEMKARFEEFMNSMPWYSVYNPSHVGSVVQRSIRDSTAFPFTIAREETLWREETWRLELLMISGMDPTILEWVSEERYIFLYEEMTSSRFASSQAMHKPWQELHASH